MHHPLFLWKDLGKFELSKFQDKRFKMHICGCLQTTVNISQSNLCFFDLLVWVWSLEVLYWCLRLARHLVTRAWSIWASGHVIILSLNWAWARLVWYSCMYMVFELELANSLWKAWEIFKMSSWSHVTRTQLKVWVKARVWARLNEGSSFEYIRKASGLSNIRLELGSNNHHVRKQAQTGIVHYQIELWTGCFQGSLFIYNLTKELVKFYFNKVENDSVELYYGVI